MLVTIRTRLISLFDLVMILGLIAFRYSILQLFGDEFIQRQTALIILSIGYLVNAMTGSFVLLLNMTGHTKFSAAAVAFRASLNVCIRLSKCIFNNFLKLLVSNLASLLTGWFSIQFRVSVIQV
jgi:hypothetical protein